MAALEEGGGGGGVAQRYRTAQSTRVSKREIKLASGSDGRELA